ncbi:hypothetical protein D3C71_24070 [compost metagenome]
MHVIPAFRAGIRLYSRDGACIRYPSLSAAFDALGFYWIKSRVGREFVAADPWSFAPSVDWVMRTDFDEVVTAADFEELRAADLARRYRRLPYSGHGPVPGVHRMRGGRYFRRLNHMNELRSAALVLREEGEVAPRAKRSPRNLPNPRDDYSIAAREDRSWKRHRRTQWKSR